MEPPGIDAPRVVGASVPLARSRVFAAAEQADVAPPAVRVVGRAYSEAARAGEIIAQDPAPKEHVAATGALRVRVSLGTPWADVPETIGTRTADARRALAAAGFRAARRYAPSLTVGPWRVAETRPGPGERVRRPATVTIVVSTGLPRTTVVDVRGQDADDAVSALEHAGFAVRVREAPSPTVDEGHVLEVSPGPGTRARIGSVVTLVVAREPRWETVRELDGQDDAVTPTLRVPSGGRVVLIARNTSFLGLLGGAVTAEWSGDAAGSVEVAADGGGTVLVEPAERERVVSVRVDEHGPTHWIVRVEALG
jgi:beta-lactam-binding protein with PASTA domain